MEMGGCLMMNIGMSLKSPNWSKYFSNYITHLLRVNKYFIHSISESEFQEILRVKDSDNDGYISVKEFLNSTKGTSIKKSDLAFQLLDK